MLSVYLVRADDVNLVYKYHTSQYVCYHWSCGCCVAILEQDMSSHKLNSFRQIAVRAHHN